MLWNDSSSSHWIPSVTPLEPGDMEEVHSYKCLSIVIDDSITTNLNKGTTEKKSKLGLYFQKTCCFCLSVKKIILLLIEKNIIS